MGLLPHFFRGNMKKRNYAKINLTLDILGVLENGYHDLKMVMQLIDLYDEVDVSWEEGGNALAIEITSNRDDIPLDERNIAWKAAELVAGDSCGKVKIYIEKNIPVAAGLAGGSGNAAVVIECLNELMGLGMTGEEMMEMGGKIGKDVPFIISGYPCAIATGDGTELEPVEPADCFILLSKPDISVSTGEAYRKYDEIMPDYHPDTEGMLDAIKEKNTAEMGKKTGNVLEFVTAGEYNCINNTKDIMLSCEGNLGASMSGSGPSVFGIFRSKEDTEKASEKLLEINRETFVARTITE